MTTALAIFARAPLPGRAKTRLIGGSLDAAGAAALYAAFLRDVLRTGRALRGIDLAVWAADADGVALLEEIADGVPVRTQPSGDLGARIAAAIADGVAAHGRAIVIGSDAPTLPARALERAIDALDRAELVIGPAADGGYYLIGARRPLAFDGPVRWSTRSALADTLRAVGGAAPALLAPWYDVDTPDDLRLLRTHLALDPRIAPATAAALGLAPRPLLTEP